MAQKLKYSINMVFRVNEDEKFFIEKRMKAAIWTNFRNFVLNCLVRGEIVKLDLAEILTLAAGVTTGVAPCKGGITEPSAVDMSDGRGRDCGYRETPLAKVRSRLHNGSRHRRQRTRAVAFGREN